VELKRAECLMGRMSTMSHVTELRVQKMPFALSSRRQFLNEGKKCKPKILET
jgi:hypothetical protein